MAYNHAAAFRPAVTGHGLGYYGEGWTENGMEMQGVRSRDGWRGKRGDEQGERDKRTPKGEL